MGFTAVAVQPIASFADTVEMELSMTLLVSSATMGGRQMVRRGAIAHRHANWNLSPAHVIAAMREMPLVQQRLNARRIARLNAPPLFHVRHATPFHPLISAISQPHVSILQAIMTTVLAELGTELTVLLQPIPSSFDSPSLARNTGSLLRLASHAILFAQTPSQVRSAARKSLFRTPARVLWYESTLNGLAVLISLSWRCL